MRPTDYGRRNTRKKDLGGREEKRQVVDGEYSKGHGSHSLRRLQVDRRGRFDGTRKGKSGKGRTPSTSELLAPCSPLEDAQEEVEGCI